MTLRHMPREDERRAIADDLWGYGEDDLARHAFDLTDHELELMGEIAVSRRSSSDNLRGTAYHVSRANRSS
jgi:hypothetical protein